MISGGRYACAAFGRSNLIIVDVDKLNSSFGHSICRYLPGFDSGFPEASQRFKDDPDIEKGCTGFVQKAPEILKEIIERESYV